MATVLIIGGNSGVGAACIDAFANKGWQVVATYHQRRQRLDKRLETASGGTVSIHHLDVVNPTEVQSLRDQVHREGDDLEAIVHVASYNQPNLWNRPALEVSVDELMQCFQVEICGLHNVVAAFVPVMKPRAAIVTFSSASALHGDPDTFAYNVSKSAICTYTRMLAKEYGDHLRINCIAPDSLRTDWLTEWDVTSEQEAQFRVVRSGSRRIGEPSEAADLALWLCSSEASYVNGQTMTLDGGAG